MSLSLPIQRETPDGNTIVIDSNGDLYINGDEWTHTKWDGRPITQRLLYDIENRVDEIEYNNELTRFIEK